MEKLLQPNRMLGKHAIIDLSGCDSEIIRNCRLIHDTLIKAAEMAGLTVIGIMDHHFMPEGYTAVLMLEESHLSIHTWPEYNYASIDLYSCNLQTDFQTVIDFLANEFQATVTGFTFLERGFSEICKKK
jgi:S-adenosylmethionine decarboxylase